ncbi:MAG: bacillithiol biosynthesis cysteine-adding enzyme BshC, partial [Lysinibacillus sp.]
MKLERVSSPIQNTLLQQYWENEPSVAAFFSYAIEQQSFSTRLRSLQGQAYEREKLVQVIRSYMAPYTISEKAEQHLNLLQKNAVVVVGGQQAGLLTGPLFSIYKAITVILLAKQQSEKLQVPVVPLFWIAGEDNDIDEINHTYTMQQNRVKKQIFGAQSRVKKMASQTVFEREQLSQYVRDVFKDYGETAYTTELLQRVLAPLEKTSTYTEYFAALLNELFEHEGLLFVDAAYSPFRQLEAPYFQKIITQNEEIACAVVKQEAALTALGFAAPLEANEANANLFYVDEGERFLLERK